MQKKGDEDKWDMKHLNKQLYGILGEVCSGRAKGVVIARHKEVKGEEGTNGARI